MALENYLDKLKWLFYSAGFPCPMRGFGNIPGKISGLAGIIFDPFIHVDISCLSANSLSLLFPGFIFVSADIERYGSDTD